MPGVLSQFGDTMTDALDDRRRALRTRLIILVFALVLPMTVVAGLVFTAAQRNAEAAARAALLHSAQSAMAAVDRDLQTTFTSMEVLALLPELQNGDMAAFKPHSDRYLARARPGVTMAVIAPDGQLILSTVAKPGTPLPKRNNPFTDDMIFVQKKRYASEVRLGTLVKRPLLSFDIPVFRGEEVAYDLAINPTREAFVGILNDLAVPEGWVVSLLDKNANHVARIPAVPEDALVPAPDSLKAELANGDNRVVETLAEDGTPMLTAFSHSDGNGWTVAVGMPRAQVDGRLRSALFTAVGLSAIILIAGLFFATRIAAREP